MLADAPAAASVAGCPLPVALDGAIAFDLESAAGTGTLPRPMPAAPTLVGADP